MTWPVKHRQVLNLVGPAILVALVGLGLGNHRYFRAGVSVVLLGQLLRIWAAGCLRKGAGLTPHGPFALTRNPLYLGSFTIGIGQCLVCGIIEAILVFVILFALIYCPTIAGEERALTADLGESYQEYLKTAPRFLPFGGNWSLARRGFATRQVFVNREYEAVAANAVFIFVVFVLTNLRG
ncbi:MAG: hypothetical protein AUJ92_04200 [Armatimonadetes bacterium CG2_30_59_28]|nr:MAG: hypothetical protein AUJ92_04200 [Armatimonadetes bacterium CG2_30_59_28]